METSKSEPRARPAPETHDGMGDEGVAIPARNVVPLARRVIPFARTNYPRPPSRTGDSQSGATTGEDDDPGPRAA